MKTSLAMWKKKLGKDHIHMRIWIEFLAPPKKKQSARLHTSEDSACIPNPLLLLITLV